MTIFYRPLRQVLAPEPPDREVKLNPLELHVSRFFKEAADPSMVVGMAFGASAFNAARLLVLPTLMRSASPLLSQVPFLTRATASSIALVPELGAFWGSSKAIQEMMHPGSNHWDLKSNAQEIAHLAMTLGFLKSTGFVFGGMGILAKQHGIGMLPKHPMFWQQSGMLSGIMAGQGAELALGWRAPGDLSAFLVDSLITLGHFNVGGALSHQVFPGVYRFNTRMQQRMASQERAQLENLAKRLPSDLISDAGGWALAGVGISPSLSPETGLPMINRSTGGGGSPKAPKKLGGTNPQQEKISGNFRPGDSIEEIRSEVQKEFPGLQKLLNDMSTGEEVATNKIRNWDVTELLRQSSTLQDKLAKLLLVLTEFGNRQAAQALVDHATESSAALTALQILSEHRSPLVRQTIASTLLDPEGFSMAPDNLRMARAMEVLTSLGQGDAAVVLGELAESGDATALDVLMDLAKKSNGPAVATLRDLSNYNPEFRPDFLEAIRDYAWELRSTEGGDEVPGAALVLFETLAPTGPLPDFYRIFPKYVITELSRDGEMLLEDLRDRSSVYKTRGIYRDQHPFRAGDRVVVLRKISGASPAEDGNPPARKIEIIPDQGVGKDLITLMGEKPSIAGGDTVQGITRERAAELEALFEEGSVIWDLPGRGPAIAKLESGATTIGGLEKVTPQEVKFYEAWKHELGFNPVDPQQAQRAWRRIQERAAAFRIQIRFGKNHHFDPMNRPGGSDQVYQEFGGQIVFLEELLHLLPKSLLRNPKLRDIRLNTDRVGAGKLSSFENGRVFLYEGTFLGSRRNLAAMLLHEVGHATAARYRVHVTQKNLPTSLPPGSDHLGDLNIPQEVREEIRRAHQTIAEQNALLGLDFAGGPFYRTGYQANSFSEFIADLHVLYVAAGPRLRSHTQSFPRGSEIRQAWEFVYDEMKNRIFSGQEYGYQGLGETKIPSLRPEDILVEMKTPSLRPEDILVEVEATVALGAELKETWPVTYQGEQGRMRIGGLVKAQSFSPQELSADIYRGRKYTVKAAGADDSLILGNAKGDTLIARGLKETSLVKSISVGEEVILIPSLAGGSPEQDPPGVRKRLPTGELMEDFLAKQKKRPGSTSSIPPERRRRKTLERITGNFWVKPGDLRVQAIVENIDDTQFTFDSRTLRHRFNDFIHRELTPGVDSATQGKFSILDRLMNATGAYQQAIKADPFRTASHDTRFEYYLIQVALERALMGKNQPAFHELTRLVGEKPEISGLEKFFREQDWLESYGLEIGLMDKVPSATALMNALDQFPLHKDTNLFLAAYLATYSFAPGTKAFRDPDFNFIREGHPGGGEGASFPMWPEFARTVILENVRKRAVDPEWVEALNGTVERAVESRIPLLYFDYLVKVMEFSEPQTVPMIGRRPIF